MFKSYFKTALRDLRRRKGYAVVNVFGLAAGMAACLLIGLYVRHELSYDTFHEKAERIYRIDEFAPTLQESGEDPSAWVQSKTAPTLKETIPEVERAVRLSQLRSGLRREDAVFNDVQGMFAGRAFFDLFDFEVLAGDPESLARPNTVLLTRPTAQKLFGDGEALGKTVSVEVRGRPTALEVTGVTAAVPSNAHFTFDFLVSLQTLRAAISPGDFEAHELWTYVLLQEGVAPEALQTSLAKVAANFAYSPEYALLFHPLPDLYLHHWSPRQGDPRYLYLFGAVAVVILLIAVANYTSLATARATRRAREVGVRKVVGARREQLAGQFLGEAVLVSLLALPVALGLLTGALPFFNAVAGTEIGFGPASHAGTLAALAGLAVAVGLVAGAYPALFLSRFRPAEVLRERLPSGVSGAWLRKGLTVFQFALSAALLFSTAVIVQQLRYVQEKNLGFDEERVVALPLQSRALAEQGPALQQELARLPGVQRVALGSGLPGKKGFSASRFDWNGEEVKLTHLVVSPGFAETLGLRMVAGRGFSAARQSADASAYVVNEAAARALGWARPQEAVGQEISFFGETHRIIGVTEDFHYESLHTEIAPLTLELGPYGHVAAVRLAGGQTASTLAAMEETWAQFTDQPFAYTFLDERIGQLYAQERRTARVLGGFAGLALLLACLGLFALATYAVERRTKEISIRKVMGASVTNVVMLLSKDFLKLLAVALAIAAPLAWWGTRRWLESFAYHVSPGPALYLGVGAAVLLVALFAVGYQSVRAALANPAEHLRSE